MKITADTNVLVRAVVGDDPAQGRVASEALSEADTIAVTLPALCEFVWVLSRWYKFKAGEIAQAIKGLIDSAEVRADQPAIHAGLAVLEAGGDFADGVIAFEGRRLGGTVFTSFDRNAVELIGAGGGETRLLSSR